MLVIAIHGLCWRVVKSDTTVVVKTDTYEGLSEIKVVYFLLFLDIKILPLPLFLVVLLSTCLTYKCPINNC